jgi:hypothetical protein
MRGTKLITGLFGIVLVLSVGTVFATETVIIGGWRITCPSSCVITYGSNGTFSASDANGGQILITTDPPPPLPKDAEVK